MLLAGFIILIIVGGLNALHLEVHNHWTPQVLANLRQSWPIFSLSLQSIADNIVGTLDNVYTSSNPLFSYHDIAVARQHINFSGEFDFVDNLPARDIIFPAANFSEYKYYSGNLNLPQFETIRSQLDLHSLVGREMLPHITSTIWLSQHGIASTTHYDAVNNIYVQLHGNKRIRLYAPTQALTFQMHGRHHPYACQSRIRNVYSGVMFNRSFTVRSRQIHNKDDICMEKTTEHCEMSALNMPSPFADVLLTPGDVMFIPAFWLHEVQAVTAAVSVSLWWEGTSWDIMDKVYGLPLPFDSEDLALLSGAIGLCDSQEACRVVCTVQAFLTALINAISQMIAAHRVCVKPKHSALSVYCSEARFQADVQAMLRTRYKEDFAAYSCESRVINAYTCDVTTVWSAVPSPLLITRAGQYAVTFSEFLQQDAHKEQSCSSCDDDGEVTYDDDDAGGVVLDSSIAILMLKLCDYVEDVLQFVDEKRHPIEHMLLWLGQTSFLSNEV